MLAAAAAAWAVQAAALRGRPPADVAEGLAARIGAALAEHQGAAAAEMARTLRARRGPRR